MTEDELKPIGTSKYKITETGQVLKMTVEELEKATGKELIEERDYCGVDGYRGNYLDEVNAEMLKRFNRFAELEKEKCELLGIIQGKDKVIQELKNQQLTKAKEIIKEMLSILPKENI